jgi:hypothetical protein
MSRPVQAVVLESLMRLVTASPQEIAARYQKADASVSGVAVRKALRRMLARGVVRKVGYGRYSLSAEYWERMEPPGDLMRREITDFLSDVGGVAKRSEINRRFGAHPEGEERDALYRRITTTLAEGGNFRQDFGHGVWNLPREELEYLPLTGRWATQRLLKVDGSTAALERAQVYFNGVGAAFSRARDRFIEDLVEDPDLRELLEELGSKCPNLLSRLWTGRNVIGESRKMPHAALYAAFESGNFTLHRTAPAAFYRRCAEMFGCDPGPLSRGGADLAEVLPEALLFAEGEPGVPVETIT